jgi:hypothetical protein
MRARGAEPAWTPDSDRLRLFTIYLPLSTRDGRRVSTERLLWARDRIAGFAQGCTVLSPSDGLWVSQQGEIHHDSVLPIQVVAPATSESTRFFTDLAGELAVLLGQEQIFIHSAAVALVETPARRQGRLSAPAFGAGDGLAAD